MALRFVNWLFARKLSNLEVFVFVGLAAFRAEIITMLVIVTIVAIVSVIVESELESRGCITKTQ